ncbi:hypothetical protein CJU94_04445 [Paraburkholderia aromaticivorans]|uniref:Uncharacterized protein n=1 Tax=Paraburkholderia aromaticivorans TaxID=2026199 RepID=A0A248VEM1_9BURK|nr:hypothetical protein CJU94_04445 [Paraburkholderia aromaticivorans]
MLRQWQAGMSAARRDAHDRLDEAMHLDGASHAHRRRMLPSAGAIFRINFIGMCVSVRMELA